MYFLKFDNCNEFFDYFKNNNGEDDFPLVLEQILKDDCYLNDNWIEWYAYTDDSYEDDSEICAIIASKKDKSTSVIPDSDHIITLEVNKNLKGKGFGKKALSKFIDRFCTSNTIELYAEKHNWGFYEKLGFKPVKGLLLAKVK